MGDRDDDIVSDDLAYISGAWFSGVQSDGFGFE